MHKKSKRIFASVLIVVLFVCAFFCVNKNPNVEAVTEDDGVLYYSELFYGYPHYIANDQYFKSYSSSISGVYDAVYSSYKNSSLVVGTGLEYALDTITSPTDIAKLITDKLGITDFSYNDALDAANREFVKHIMSDSLAYSVGSSYGKTAKTIGKINSTIGIFNKFAAESNGGIKYTVEYYLQEAFDYLQYKGYLNFVSESTLSELWCEINSEDFALSDCFDLAVTEIEVAEAIMSAIVLEDSRLEIVNDILSTQNSETVLKQGMTRLKSDLQRNFIDRFIDNYLKEKLADELFGKIDSFVVDIIGGKELKIILSVAKKAFNHVVDVPKFADVLKWQVLICYSNDLANVIPDVAATFDGGPFFSDKIIKYENLFIGYDAANKAAMASTTAVSNMLDPFSEAYGVLAEAAENNIENITITSGVIEISIPSTTTNEQLRDHLISGVIISSGTSIALKKEIKISNGISTVKVPIKANTWAIIMQDSVSDNAQTILNFNSNYDDISLYGEHINSVVAAVQKNPVSLPKETYSDWTYVIQSSSTQLKNDSNEIMPNCIYGLNNTILGNITIISDNTLTISKDVDIAIDGDVLVGRGTDREEGSMIVDGKLTVKGNLTLYLHSEISNNGELIVEKKMNCSSAYASKIINNAKIDVNDCDLTNEEFSYVSNNDSELYVSGALAGNGKAMGGLIILDGTEIQSIRNLYSSYVLDVQNKNGLNYIGTVYVSGWYKLNNNPLTLNGNETYAYNGARFDDSYYETIKAFDLILLDSVNANILLGDKMTLTIPKDKDITVERNIFIGSSSGHENGKMIVDGKLTVKGNLTLYLHSEISNNGELIVEKKMNCSSAYASKIINNAKIDVNDCDLTNEEFSYISNNDSELYVSGDFRGNDRAIGGTIIFNGYESQSVYKLNASIVVLENNSDKNVIFTSVVSASTLFNHNQTKFTLYNNGKDSIFVDYDGDGTKDNVDSYPMDPLNGQNESEFQLKMIKRGQDSYLEIAGYHGDDINVVVPDSIIGYLVTSIADGAFAGCNIESIVISGSVSKIGDSAFNNAKNLRAIEISGDNTVYCSVDGILYSFDKTILIRYPVANKNTAFTIPDSVKKIEDNAFNGSENLKSVDIPESVKEIESNSFVGANISSIKYLGSERKWDAVNKASDSGLSALTVRFGKFTATFICEGITISQVDYKPGETIESSESIPDKKYYSFTGWTPELPETMPEQDIEFTAVWELSEATRLLEFYVDDELYFSEYRFEGEEVTIPESPSKEGYTFAKWSPDVVETMPNENLTYDAIWNVNIHQVSFIVDGENYHSYDSAYQDTLTTPDNPIKEGYTFVGWTPAVPDYMPDIEMTFTAVFEPITYTATFTSGGETIGTDEFVISDESLDYPVIEEKAGYEWVWDKHEIIADDITINGKYSLVSYTVTFVANGTVVDIIEFNVENQSVVAPEIPPKIGYSESWEEYKITLTDLTVNAIYTPVVYFARFWCEGNLVRTSKFTVENKKSDFTMPYLPERKGYKLVWQNFEVVPNDIDIYGEYVPIEYTATFIADGVVVSTQTFTVETESLDEPPVPQKAGYYACWSYYKIEAKDIKIVAQYHSPEVIATSKATLDVGNTYLLLPSCNFETTDITWTSSDTSVATVNSNGKVTAVREGKCKITITCYGKDSLGNDIKASKSTNIIVNGNPGTTDIKQSFREMFDEFFEVTLHDILFNFKEFMKVFLKYAY